MASTHKYWFPLLCFLLRRNASSSTLLISFQPEMCHSWPLSTASLLFSPGREWINFIREFWKCKPGKVSPALPFFPFGSSSPAECCKSYLVGPIVAWDQGGSVSLILAGPFCFYAKLHPQFSLDSIK